MNQKTAVTTTAPPAQSSALVASVALEGGARTVAQIKSNRAHVKAIMKDLMEEGIHYGTINGTDKPTILKPGTELLMSLFGIDGQPEVEDLSDEDCVRYRIVMKGVHAASGTTLGHGVGECSTDEEKYKWRACYNNREWENRAEDRSRVKYGWDKKERREYEVRQVRTNPADAANTVLKMAKKRAQSDMVLTVLAVSDIFLQDAEDMAEWLREGDTPPDGAPSPATSKATSTSRPQAKAAAAQTVLNEQQLAHLRREIDKVGCGERPVCLQFNVDTLEALPFAQLNAALKYVAGMQQEPPT